MGKNALKYAAVLIATYLVVSKATGFGTAVKATGGQAIGLTKALQGR
jgi:hypothetical protein